MQRTHACMERAVHMSTMHTYYVHTKTNFPKTLQFDSTISKVSFEEEAGIGDEVCVLFLH